MIGPPRDDGVRWYRGGFLFFFTLGSRVGASVHPDISYESSCDSTILEKNKFRNIDWGWLTTFPSMDVVAAVVVLEEDNDSNNIASVGNISWYRLDRVNPDT